jgi:hypothetical protein
MKYIVLAALLGFSMAAPTIKKSLAQTRIRGGDDPVETPGEELELCTCELSGIVGGGFGAPGQGNNGASGAAIVESVGEEAESIPDTEWHSLCESECCACNVGQHAAEATATRTKHFDISGSIDISETIEWAENGEAEEESRGYSIKETACITNNESVEDVPVSVGEPCVCEDDDENGAAY